MAIIEILQDKENWSELNLIEIDWELNYDLLAGTGDIRLVRDDTGEEGIAVTEYDSEGIPMGREMEDIKKRETILSRFLHDWSQKQEGERKVHNMVLDEDIYVIGKSVAEIIQHASKRYLSTKAALLLEEVIAHAYPARRVPVKQGNKKQAEFEYMLLMTYRKEELGTVKVTVGVKYRKQNDKDDDRPKKIEYGISVLDPGEELVKTGTEEKRNRKDKRKASHKK